MLNIVICDAEKTQLDRVCKILEEIFFEYHLECNIKKFTSSEDVLNQVTKTDMAILDIIIGEKSGIELGRKLRNKFPQMQLIYITSYEEYAIQTINIVHAYAYLGKPVSKSQMENQIQGLIHDNLLTLNDTKQFYNLKDKNGIYIPVVKLCIDDILYFECVKRKRRVRIVLRNEIYEYEETFENIINEFEKYDFVVNCRGSMVNLKHVIKIKGYEVFLDNNTKLVVSQRRIMNLKCKLDIFIHSK